MSQVPVLSVPQLVVSLEIVARWREETEEDIRKQIGEIDEEEQRLQTSIEELTRQLKAVSAMREEVSARLGQLDDEETERARDTLLSGLEQESALLDERAAIYDEAVTTRKAAIDAMMSDPEVAALVEEFKQFEEAEPTLELLPAGYRKAVQAHHDEVKARLQPVMAAANAEPDPIQAEQAGFTVVASLDPPEGTPEALAIIVPVSFDTYAHWSERPEDLQSLIAYRMVGLVANVLREVGAADAPIQYAPYEGKLAIHVWRLAEAELVADLKETLQRHVQSLKDEAGELSTARLEPHLVWLSPDAIIPEEDDLDEEDVEEEYDG